MEFFDLVFWLYSFVLIASAAMVVSARNPVHAAFYLILAFFTCAAIWMLLEAEFLALVLVLVYVGAVMILFLFVVMMLDVNIAPLKEGFIKYLPVGLFVGVTMVAELVLVIISDKFKANIVANPVTHGPEYSNTSELGVLLYTEYLFQFEIAALILLVAIIAAIALTLRSRPENKYQVPSKQIEVTKAERLKVIKMNAEQK